MLDEKKEYEEYTNLDLERILGQTNKPPFLGLYRVLVTIARYHLFSETNGKYEELSAKEQEARRELVYDELLSWCGFCSEKDNTDSSLYRLFLRECLASESKKEIEDAEKFAKARFEKFREAKEQKSGWKVNNIYNTLEFSNPNIDAFNFHIVIADAIQRGPLQQKKMICKKNFYENMEFNSVKENQFLKLLAACLLCDKFAYEDQEIDEKYPYVCFNPDKQALANWMRYLSFSNPNKHADYFEDYVYFDERYPIVKIENRRVKILKQYLIDYDFQIVDSNYMLSDAEQLNYLLIEDCGAQSALDYSIPDEDRAAAYFEKRKLLKEYAIVTIEKGGPQTYEKNKYPFYLVTGIDTEGYERILCVKKPYGKEKTIADIYEEIFLELKKRGVEKIHFFADYEDLENKKGTTESENYRKAKQIVLSRFKDVIFVKATDEDLHKIGVGHNLFKANRLYHSKTNKIYQEIMEENESKTYHNCAEEWNRRLMTIAFYASQKQVQTIPKWELIWKTLRDKTLL